MSVKEKKLNALMDDLVSLGTSYEMTSSSEEIDKEVEEVKRKIRKYVVNCIKQVIRRWGT